MATSPWLLWRRQPRRNAHRPRGLFRLAVAKRLLGDDAVAVAIANCNVGSSTMSASRNTFESLIGQRACSCTTVCDCTSLLREYFEDPSSPYPGGEVKLIFRMRNPRLSGGDRYLGQQAMKEQIYDRAAELLRVDSPETLDRINIGIIHFHREVINHYNNAASKPKNFLEYLLPSDLVANCNLGVKFTTVDAFRCIGTSKEYSKCKRRGKCRCGKYLNSPFVTRDRIINSVERPSSDRAHRSAQFSANRRAAMAEDEIKVQSA